MSLHKSALIFSLSILSWLGLAGSSSSTTISTTINIGKQGGASTPISVNWDLSTDRWMLVLERLFYLSQNTYGPLLKHFQSPPSLQLEPSNPVPLVLREEVTELVQTLGLYDHYWFGWNEEIQTPGWEWVLPGDPRFPTLFPPGQTLFERFGGPLEYSIEDPHTPYPNIKLWAKFVPPLWVWPWDPWSENPNPPVPGFQVNKALLWVGTARNQTWGDGVDDAGNPLDESFIDVLEYPTPEPTTASLLCIGLLGLFCRRRV